MKAKSPILYFCFFLLTLNSCIAPEELQNFNQGPEFPSQAVDITIKSDIIIQPDDELSITVYAFDKLAAAPFNISSSVSDGNVSNLSSAISTYLVGSEGYIDFPELGPIQVGGLSIEEAKNILIEKLKGYLKNPIVNIRFTNFRITVIGEVNSPSTFTFPDEKVTLLEAIGMAGDLTSYGDRKDILIIREQNGTREFGKVNLRDRQIFESPYFYLKQNDVIYVYPIKDKSATVNTQTQRIIPWVTALSTVATLIVTITLNR